MPYVSCPTCGERGKIPTDLIGVRIKCKKCGLSFLVAPPPAAKAGTTTTAATAPMPSSGPSAAVELHGIEVEGLDASSWAVPIDTAIALKAQTDHAAQAPDAHAASSSSASVSVTPAPDRTREYKLVSSRDKIFAGRFDLARLEEVLNDLGLQGWVAKSMLAPHLKGFSGALEETIVVLLERCK